MTFTFKGVPSTGGGAGYTPGHWRADKASGRIAVPEGPTAPRVLPEPVSNTKAGQRMREATARNQAERHHALSPRRYRPNPEA